MTQAPAYFSYESSRLVNFLSSLAVSDAKVSHKNFADKLGRLIDLSDSFALSETLRGLPRIDYEPNTAATTEIITEEFLKARAEMVQSIIKSFVPDAGTLPFNLPIPDADTMVDGKTAIEPYLRLYTLHQSDMGYRVQKIRIRVREAISGRSSTLAQLAALDAALGDTLSVHTRKTFTVIPKLLGKRFQHLHNEHQQIRNEHQQTHASQEQDDNPELWVQTGGWLDKFYKEMQGLLLAELELRLQPVVGLIEALDEEVELNL